MEALGINLGYLLTQILGITALILLLTAFVYKPVLRVLDQRKARIAARRADASDATEAVLLRAARVDPGPITWHRVAAEAGAAAAARAALGMDSPSMC